jgi:hypothetical protein
MLQGVKAEIGEFGGILMPKNAEHSTIVLRVVLHQTCVPGGKRPNA